MSGGYPVTVTRTYGTIHHEQDANPEQGGILLTLNQVNGWAAIGRDLTEEELDRLADAIPHSSIPEAITAIVSDALGLVHVEDLDLTADEMRERGIDPVDRATCEHGGLLLCEDPDVYDCTKGCGDD